MPPQPLGSSLRLPLLAGCFFIAQCIAQTADQTSPNTGDGPQSDRASHRYLWNSNSLAGAYATHGHKNTRWNDAAYATLEAFARVRSVDGAARAPFTKAVITQVQRAISEGCDDPMIRYLYVRNVELTNRTPEQKNDYYRHVAADMKASSYPAIRKFYATLRMANELDRVSKKTPPEVRLLWQDAQNALIESLHDTNMPPEEVGDACFALMETRDFQYDPFRAFEVIAFTNWPALPMLHYLRAEALIRNAWNARGGGYANTVSDDQWKAFYERLEVAAESIESSVRLFPNDGRFPTKMITVEMGRGRNRPGMEKWFKQAMRVNTNNYDACLAKLLYLEPKWYGSSKDLVEFGRQCVASTQWGGDVPIILVDAHCQVAGYLPPEKQEAYWKQKEVWMDIKSAYEKALLLNPDQNHLHVHLARYAHRAEQWEELNRQIGLFKDPDPYIVGGPEPFEKMLKDAKAHQKPAK